MNKKYICYCGLYCENCVVMAKVTPASKVLYAEMKKAGFEEIINLIPGGDGFWPFLKRMAEDGFCISCKAGSSNPDCAVRICAKEKGTEICVLCDSYPCEKLSALFESYPVLKGDNDLLREKGMDTLPRKSVIDMQARAIASTSCLLNLYIICGVFFLPPALSSLKGVSPSASSALPDEKILATNCKYLEDTRY